MTKSKSCRAQDDIGFTDGVEQMLSDHKKKGEKLKKKRRKMIDKEKIEKPLYRYIHKCL